MVDVASTSLTSHEKRRLKHPLVGGVILFARNFEDRRQLEALCRDIHGSRNEPLLIAVDHEGGRVQRFRTDGFTPNPPMGHLAE
jgi:beta-N-acetylhexosaminidase